MKRKLIIEQCRVDEPERVLHLTVRGEIEHRTDSRQKRFVWRRYSMEEGQSVIFRFRQSAGGRAQIGSPSLLLLRFSLKKYFLPVNRKRMKQYILIFYSAGKISGGIGLML